MISININGTSHTLEKGSTLSQALDILNINTTDNQKSDADDKLKFKDFVIALNQTFIPRSQYQQTKLHNNDTVELLSPMAGG